MLRSVSWQILTDVSKERIAFIFKDKHSVRLDFCLTVYNQLGKVIQKNQLEATMIY